MRYYVAHMKDGRTLRFEERATRLRQLDHTSCIVFEDGPYEDTLGIVPVENILWIECVEKE